MPISSMLNFSSNTHPNIGVGCNTLFHENRRGESSFERNQLDGQAGECDYVHRLERSADEEHVSL